MPGWKQKKIDARKALWLSTHNRHLVTQSPATHLCHWGVRTLARAWNLFWGWRSSRSQGCVGSAGPAASTWRSWPGPGSVGGNGSRPRPVAEWLCVFQAEERTPDTNKPLQLLSLYIISYHIISYIISYHTTSHHTISYHISYHITSPHILVYTTQVNYSAFRAIWLVPQSRDIKWYSPPGGFRRKRGRAKPISSENKITIWELVPNLCCIY